MRNISNLFVLLTFFALFFIFHSNASAAVLFEDNFNSYPNNSFPNKWIKYSPQPIPGCNANWAVVNGEFGVSIPSQGGCADNMIPISSLWAIPLNKYVFEVDMRFVSGVDHNLPYIIETNSSTIYEIHFQSPGDFALGGPVSQVIVNVPQGYSNGNTFHVKVIVNSSNVKVIINNNLVREVNLSSPLPLGTIGLRAGVGADPSSETWFDNVRVTTLDHQDSVNLNVPLLKQTDPQWGSQIYDSANLWSQSGTGISSWGCAMTSAAMVFKYFGINKLPDGVTVLDPGTLNTWLKSQSDGYVRDGWLNWLALSRLSKLAPHPSSYDALEYRRISGANNATIAASLDLKLPVILEEPGHFIVAKGINGNSFDINDPFYSRTSLNDYGNSFISLGRYVPSYTDLSYFMFAVDKDIEIHLFDSNNTEVGSQFLQDPIIDPTNQTSKNGKPLKFLMLQKPENGKYKLTITSNTNQNYTLDSYLYDLNGNVKQEKGTGVVGGGNNDSLAINFDKNNSNNSSFQQAISFDSFRSDVKTFFALKLIKNFVLEQKLLAKIGLAEKSSRNSKIVTKAILLTIKKDLQNEKGKNIDANAFAILDQQITYLISQY